MPTVHFWAFLLGCMCSFALAGFIQKSAQGENIPTSIKWGLKISAAGTAIVVANYALTMVPH